MPRQPRGATRSKVAKAGVFNRAALAGKAALSRVQERAHARAVAVAARLQEAHRGLAQRMHALRAGSGEEAEEARRAVDALQAEVRDAMREAYGEEAMEPREEDAACIAECGQETWRYNLGLDYPVLNQGMLNERLVFSLVIVHPEDGRVLAERYWNKNLVTMFQAACVLSADPELIRMLSPWTEPLRHTGQEREGALRLMLSMNTQLSVDLVLPLLENEAILQHASECVNRRGLLREAAFNPCVSVEILRLVIERFGPFTSATWTGVQQAPLSTFLRAHCCLTPELVAFVLEDDDPLGFGTAERMFALHCAASNVVGAINLPVVELLIELLGPEVAEHPYVGGHLPIHRLLEPRQSIFASTRPCAPAVDVVLKILELYPDAVYRCDRFGNTPLHTAATNAQLGCEVVCDILLASNPAAASKVNEAGETPLHCVLRHRTHPPPDHAIVAALLEAGPGALRSPGPGTNDRTPFIIATQNPCITPEVLYYLFDWSVPTAAEARNALVRLLQTHTNPSFELLRRLLDAQVDTQLQTDSGTNVFHEDAQGDIDTGSGASEPRPSSAADGSVRSRRRTLLHHALSNPCAHPEVAAHLIQQDPSQIFARDAKGELPYHCLSEKLEEPRRVALVECLLSARPVDFHAAAQGAAMTQLGAKYTAPQDEVFHRPSKLSRQGRLKVGVHVALRGEANAFGFQTGGETRTELMRKVRRDLNDTNERPEQELFVRTLADTAGIVDHLRTVDVSSLFRLLELLGKNHHFDVLRKLVEFGLVPSWNPAANRSNQQEWVKLLSTAMRHTELQWLETRMKDGAQQVSDATLLPDPLRQPGVWLLVGALRSGSLAKAQDALRMVDESTAIDVLNNAHSCPFGCCVLCSVVEFGDEELLEWILARGARCICVRMPRTSVDDAETTSTAFLTAAQRNKVSLLDFCRSRPNVFLLRDAKQLMAAAAKSGSLDAVIWVHKRFNVSSYSAHEAAVRRHVAVARFLRERQLASFAFETAEHLVHLSPDGTLPMLQYLVESGVTRLAPFLVIRAANSVNVRPDVLAWILEHLSPRDLAMVPEAADELSRSRQLWLARAGKKCSPPLRLACEDPPEGRGPHGPSSRARRGDAPQQLRMASERPAPAAGAAGLVPPLSVPLSAVIPLPMEARGRGPRLPLPAPTWTPTTSDSGPPTAQASAAQLFSFGHARTTAKKKKGGSDRNASVTFAVATTRLDAARAPPVSSPSQSPAIPSPALSFTAAADSPQAPQASDRDAAGGRPPPLQAQHATPSSAVATASGHAVPRFSFGGLVPQAPARQDSSGRAGGDEEDRPTPSARAARFNFGSSPSRGPGS